MGDLGGDRDGRVVREGHNTVNTVLVVRNPFIAVGGTASLRVVHGDGIHGESFCGLRDTTRGYHAKFSKDVN